MSYFRPPAVHHVGEQERATCILRQVALELPAHQRMQLGVLVDRPVDPHHQALRLERGEVLLEVERRARFGGLGVARVGPVEHHFLFF
jgi:hypothetical protein